MKIILSNFFERKLFFGTILLNLLLAMLAIAFLAISRSHYQDRLEITGRDLVQLLEQRIVDKVRLVDDAVVRVERELNRQLMVGDIEISRLEQLLESELKQLPETNSILVSNAAGDLLWGKGIIPGVNTGIADRAYFKKFQKQAANNLIITEPVIGKVSGLWVLCFARCYHAADGGFAGVISASVPVDTFSKLLETTNIGRKGTVSLRYDDMGLIARFPPLNGTAGQPGNKKVSNEFVKILESGLREAMFHTAQTPDSVERTYSFRRVSGRPFTLAVGLNEDEYLTPWRTQIVWVCALLGIFFLVTLFFTWMTVRHLRERSVMEKARNEDATRRHILIEKSRDGIVILDNHGKVSEANQRFTDWFGYTPEEIQQLHVWDWDAQWAPEQFAERIKQCDSTSNYFETTCRRKDGTFFYAEISANEVEYEGSKMVFCVCRDITERKRSEAEREQLIAAIEQSGETVIITDLKGTIQYVNRAFEKVTGFTREEAVGQSTRILKSGKQDEAFYRQLWATISGGNIYKGRIINKRKDGTLYTDAVTISPVFDAAGAIVNYVTVKRDITATIQLQEQFNQAQKMESVGRLAGGVAHDFNNLLNVILGYAELALGKVDPSDSVHGALKEIYNAGRRSADITRQLLAFARKQTIAPQILDLNWTVESMLKMLQRLIGEDINLAWLPSADPGKVKIDPSQIDQMLANLCVNARDAIAGVGKVTIETGSRTFDEIYCAVHKGFIPGDFVFLAVSDDGCGMDKETLDKIFEPFFTTKEDGRGTGLGLATVYGIVKQNDGFVNVYTEPGQGTTFKIYLPLQKDAAVQIPVKTTTEIPAGHGETILIVEDDIAVLRLCETMLEKFNYTVITANTPSDALRLMEERSNKIDLLITDVVMPEMNGRDLANQLHILNPDIKTLFMSGYTANVIAHHGVLDTGVCFINKPFSAGDFAAKVQEALEQK